MGSTLESFLGLSGASPSINSSSLPVPIEEEEEEKVINSQT